MNEANSQVAWRLTATFANNTATDGGGLYAVGDANITGTGGGRITFANNTAQKGGGLYSQGNVSIAGSGAVFANNTASQGGGIWAKDGVRLAPDAANTIAFDTARDNIHINSTTGTLTLDGTGVVSFNSTNNHVPGGVLIASGRTELRGAAVFDRTSLNMTGGTLYMGGGNFATWGNSASGLTVAARKIPFGTGNVGSGATASYATNLTRFHVGDNAVLALDMNHPGNANLPYFTLNNGTASTGSNTTLHGVIGSALTGNALDKFDHTYVIFTGSNGTIDDFTPSRYTTSHLLFNLGNPVYDATTGTFAVTLARGELPPLAPVPPPTEKDECPPPFPEKNLIKEVEQIIIHDYLYNGADQQGTLVGQNPFLDALFYVKPDGDPLLNCEQRFKSLLSAVYMGVFTGAREIMSETGTRLRTMLFSPNGTRENQGMRATFGFMPQSSVRWGEDNQRAGLSPLASLGSGGIGGSGATASARSPENRGALWVLPYYNYETVHGARLYDTLQGGYDMHLYGAAVGSDVTFGDGKYVLGGLFTTGRANLETTGDLLSNTNDADFVGGMVSFRWRPTEGSELGVYGGLLHQRNDVKQNNIVHMTTRFDSTLYQAGLNGHYERLVGNKKRLLTMDVDADVQHFQQDSLTIQAAGLHVGRMNSTNATTLLFPLTLGLREEFDLKNGSRLTLGGRVGYRLAAGDRVLKGKWGVPGGSYSATVHDTETDRHTGTAGVGLKWEHDQLSLTLDYDLELSKRLRNHMLMGQILWEF